MTSKLATESPMLMKKTSSNLAKTKDDWLLLSPVEFRALQEYASYSTKKLKDIVPEFNCQGSLAVYKNEAELISYEGFRHFMELYLEADPPATLTQHLFMSFIRRPGTVGLNYGLPQAALHVGNTAATPAVPQCESPTIPSSTSEHSRLKVLSGKLNETRTSIHDKMVTLTEKFHTLGDKLSKSSSSLQNVGGMLPSTSGDDYQHRTPLLPMKLTDQVEISPLKGQKQAKSLDSQSPHISERHSRNSSVKSNRSLTNKIAQATATLEGCEFDKDAATVPLKDIVCYLSLLEAGRVEDKLEFVFRLYDSDGNGYLDNRELECIITQMMNVARYLEWDTVELEPILREMMREIDFDSDGFVSLEEWKRGGLTTIPLLVLLGFDTEVKEDGTHVWRLRHFTRPAYCNICLTLLVAWGGKQGLSCSLCKYTVHERCVHKAPNNCISTYMKTRKLATQKMTHHWVDGNCNDSCVKCKKWVKSFEGKHCRWCQATIHSKCVIQWRTECTLGPLAYHILPPTAITPTVLERQSVKDLQQNQGLKSNIGSAPMLDRKESTLSATGAGFHQSSQSFQISPAPNTRPLLVFINPKSGGKQGEKLYRKFQYLLNPRQVYNLSKCPPAEGLKMFSAAKNVNVLCCGGDGTVGWILDAMDKINYIDGERPPVCVLPLGTGNDLARCLRWGGGYEGEELHKVLQRVEKAQPVPLDRWEIRITQTDPMDKGDPFPCEIINNYFSIGVDASIARRFHLMREKYPEKFNSRMKNKLWYFEFGTSETFSATCKNLHEDIDIVCDGVSLDLAAGNPLEGLNVLNIPSIYGGSNLWGEKGTNSRFKFWRHGYKKTTLPLVLPSMASNDQSGGHSSSNDLNSSTQDMGDKQIEVVGLDSAMQVGQVKAGLRASGAQRLAQCSSVVIRTRRRFPMQIDGEPWMQPPCTIHITHKNQAVMLMAPKERRNGPWKLFAPKRRQGPSPSDD